MSSKLPFGLGVVAVRYWSNPTAKLQNEADLGFDPGHSGTHSKGLHNYAYPRTDPVIIMGILDPSGEKMLMGRQVSGRIRLSEERYE